MGFKKYASITPSTKNGIGFSLDDTDFVCLDDPPAEIWDGLNNPNLEMGTVIGFIAGAIADDKEQLLFRQKIASRTQIIPMETLSEICVDLMEQYAGRPTQRSNGSSVGPKLEEVTSMANSSSLE